MVKGSDLLVAALENEGVDRIFGVPGEENLDVVESLRNSKIELVLTRHEQAAAFMAATHGPESDHEQPAGAVSDRGCDRFDEAAHQIVAPDRERGEHSDPGP